MGGFIPPLSCPPVPAGSPGSPARGRTCSLHPVLLPGRIQQKGGQGEALGTWGWQGWHLRAWARLEGHGVRAMGTSACPGVLGALPSGVRGPRGSPLSGRPWVPPGATSTALVSAIPPAAWAHPSWAMSLLSSSVCPLAPRPVPAPEGLAWEPPEAQTPGDQERSPLPGRPCSPRTLQPGQVPICRAGLWPAVGA